jgi:hypothetical protein
MNKSHRAALCALAVLGLALAAGCESAPVRHPKHTQEFVLTPGSPAPDAELGIESAVRVVLPGPEPGSGLVWEIASNNDKVLELMRAPAPAPGGGAATAVSFYSLKPGRSVLRFVLVRPDQRETVPAGICELVVHVRD